MDKKQVIIAAARARFRYYGVAKTTMQEIAHDAGVAVGTLYLYFSNKDDLIVACAAGYVERHLQEAQAILASDLPADDMLRQYILGRFRHAKETRTASRHAAEIARAVLRVKPDRIAEESQLMWQFIVELLQRGTRQGLFAVAEPQEDAKVFLYGVAFFFPSALTQPAVEPSEADLLAVIDWFLNAWRQTAVGAKKPRGRASRANGR